MTIGTLLSIPITVESSELYPHPGRSTGNKLTTYWTCHYLLILLRTTPPLTMEACNSHTTLLPPALRSQIRHISQFSRATTMPRKRRHFFHSMDKKMGRFTSRSALRFKSIHHPVLSTSGSQAAQGSVSQSSERSCLNGVTINVKQCAVTRAWLTRHHQPGGSANSRPKSADVIRAVCVVTETRLVY